METMAGRVHQRAQMDWLHFQNFLWEDFQGCVLLRVGSEMGTPGMPEPEVVLRSDHNTGISIPTSQPNKAISPPYQC